MAKRKAARKTKTTLRATGEAPAPAPPLVSGEPAPVPLVSGTPTPVAPVAAPVAAPARASTVVPADRAVLVEMVHNLRVAAEAARIVDADPWSSLDVLWHGPSVDLKKVVIVGQDTIRAVRRAYTEGRIQGDIVVRALDLAKMIMPLIAGAAL